MKSNTYSTSWFAQLGRERQLSLSELAATAPEATLDVQGEFVVGQGPTPTWDHLGGIMRSGEVIGQGLDSLKSTQDVIRDYCVDHIGKLTIGLSCFDPSVSSIRYRDLSKSIKTILQAAGHSVRVVPGRQSTALNTAQVLYNQLSKKHFEFVLWRTSAGWSVGRTTWIQDIDAYTERDRKRPARDAHIGMLPPKLAQTLINLAQAPDGSLIYDPFCGTGVILLEAARMGYQVAGSDINPAMASATEQNLNWAQSLNPAINDRRYKPTSVQDAAKLELPDYPASIVCEGYLGRVDLKNSTDLASSIEREAKDMDIFYRQVLKYWHRQPEIQTIVMALPFWTVEGRKIRLNLLDDTEKIGYTLMQFVGSNRRELSYHRPDQIVGRLIVKLTKI